MKGFFIRLTVNDPYPKHFEFTIRASDIGTAIRRAINSFRRTEWQRRPIKAIAIFAKML